MKRILVSFCFLVLATLCSPSTVSAQGSGAYGFLPYGFYQPYGGTYGTSLRTPPYFALNPPVYYGARHARPYGLSPFASPPQVSAEENYESRLRVQFAQPRVPTPGPAPRGELQCNPCLEPVGGVVIPDTQQEAVVQQAAVVQQEAVGEIRRNPFVVNDDELAKN